MNELTDKQIADEFDLMMRPRVLPDFVVFARAVIAADRALQNNAWRKAIDAARLSLMLDITAPDANPAECVKELVSWANDLALNPAISSDAQALIDRGLAMQAERHREELLAYEVTVGNLREQAQPDATVYVEHFRGQKSMENLDWTLFADLPPGSHNLYLHPPAPQAQPERKPLSETDLLGLRWDAKCRWNSQADAYNAWDELGQDEQDLLVGREVERFHGIEE